MNTHWGKCARHHLLTNWNSSMFAGEPLGHRRLTLKHQHLFMNRWSTLWCVHPVCTHIASDMSWFNLFVWGLDGSTLPLWSTVFKTRSHIVLLYIMFITSEHIITIHTSHPALTFEVGLLYISWYASLAASSFASFFVFPEPDGYSVPLSTNLQHLKTQTSWAEWLTNRMTG